LRRQPRPPPVHPARIEEANTLTTFTDLGVHPDITQALADAGIIEPFPIQEMTIPVSLTGADVIGQAKTGTGKTLAFGVTVLSRISTRTDPDAPALPPGSPQALVVVPTRELCVQVTADLATAGARRGARVISVYGGRAYEPQIEALRAGVDVAVGTPGRLLDLARQRHLDLSHVRVLVLDEADEMLDLGFLPDVEKLIAATPATRQTMLFSATMPADVLALSRRYLRRPTHIRAQDPDAGATVAGVVQHAFRVHGLDKPEARARVLQAQGRGLTMVFTRTKRSAARLADDLAARGFAAAAVHGDLGQGAREQALRAFRSGKVDVLVATEVAARGIDVEQVTHVVNYECPDDDKTYLHRIGRTARAGASGTAVTFVDWEDLGRWRLIDSALDIGVPDPAETYSTSQHLYAELDIPPEATGVLPNAARTRPGLTAERIEDLGEPSGSRRRARGRSTARPRDREHAARAEVSGRAEPSPAHRARPRRRTRSGVQVDPGSSPSGTA
jgi:superfamily II DNA/RNA helicase